MTATDLRALLDRLGYGAAQAADAVGCSKSMMLRYLSGDAPVSPALYRSLERHAALVEIADAMYAGKKFPMTLLEERRPEVKRGRRPKAA